MKVIDGTILEPLECGVSLYAILLGSDGILGRINLGKMYILQIGKLLSSLGILGLQLYN
jgi:hypothetical protein